jgi:hypothetical protein
VPLAEGALLYAGRASDAPWAGVVSALLGGPAATAYRREPAAPDTAGLADSQLDGDVVSLLHGQQPAGQDWIPLLDTALADDLAST